MQALDDVFRENGVIFFINAVFYGCHISLLKEVFVGYYYFIVLLNINFLLDTEII